MKRWWWFGTLIWLLLSCYGLFLRVPSVDVPTVSHVDKLAHAGMFFGQFYLLGRLIKVHRKTQLVALWWVSVAWALVSELIQGFFTVRTMDFYDGVADVLGATGALSLLYHQYVRRA